MTPGTRRQSRAVDRRPFISLIFSPLYHHASYSGGQTGLTVAAGPHDCTVPYGAYPSYRCPVRAEIARTRWRPAYPLSSAFLGHGIRISRSSRSNLAAFAASWAPTRSPNVISLITSSLSRADLGAPVGPRTSQEPWGA